LALEAAARAAPVLMNEQKGLIKKNGLDQVITFFQFFGYYSEFLCALIDILLLVDFKSTD
jgi:hypothetical protein